MIKIEKIDTKAHEVVLKMDSSALTNVVNSYYEMLKKFPYLNRARDYNQLTFAKDILTYGSIDEARLQMAQKNINECHLEGEPF